ncbi:MAG: hypothetical protein ACFCAD_23860 [Pleurocapsa sp.]
MVRVKWKVLCGKTLIWLAAEILLCLVGMDDIADYSEFLFDRHSNNSSIVCLNQK